MVSEAIKKLQTMHDAYIFWVFHYSFRVIQKKEKKQLEGSNTFYYEPIINIIVTNENKADKIHV